MVARSKTKNNLRKSSRNVKGPSKVKDPKNQPSGTVLVMGDEESEDSSGPSQTLKVGRQLKKGVTSGFEAQSQESSSTV